MKKLSSFFQNNKKLSSLFPSNRGVILRTQPPLDGSTDKLGGYIRRDHSSAWRTHDPVLADREVAYELDTDTFIKGDGETPCTGLPRYVRSVPEVQTG